MSLGTDLLDTLGIPDGTAVGEHDLVTDDDVVVGGQSIVEFGVHERDVLTDECATFGGDIEAEADCRLDILDDVTNNVLIGDGAYLGERVHIADRLVVSGDLGIGDDVDIEEGFETSDWIVIRNPIPTPVLYLIILSQFLRLDGDEAADELAEALAGGSPYDLLMTPRSATVPDDTWRVSMPAHVGSDCRIHDNIRAKSTDLAEDNNVLGGLCARDDIVVGNGTRIHGDVITRNGEVRIREDIRVLGDASHNGLVLEAGAHVDGTMRVRGKVRTYRGNLPRRVE